MVRLVDDLLDVSRVSRGKIELRRERSSWPRCCATPWRPASRSMTERGTHFDVDPAAEPISSMRRDAAVAGVLEPA
jgi:hypothetical protein